MAYKRLSRKDYQNLIGIANEKKKPRARRRRKSDQRGGITIPDLLLAKMISNNNRNRAQRDAMIDTMNKSQVRRMGKLVDFFLNSCTKLPTKTIKLLSKNQEFVKAITENKVFEKSILISNDIWEKVKSNNNNNFSSIKKKKKKSSAPPIKKPKLQEEQKQKLLTIPKHSIRYELNERAKERRKKSNIMKNAKILAKGIRADEEILKFFRPNEKPFIYKLLKFLRMNGDVITWDDDTLEVNING